MADCYTVLKCVSTLSFLWMKVLGTHQAEEVELFYSERHSRLSWTSEPHKAWTEILLRNGAMRPVPVLQACGKQRTRTLLSQWIERKDARHLLMDITFAQQKEPSGENGSLQVHLFDSDVPATRFPDSLTAVKLQDSRPFHSNASLSQINQHLMHSLGLSLGVVSRVGFQLGFSYSATCVLVTSIRLYYKRCPAVHIDLVWFDSSVTATEPAVGICVENAETLSLPEKKCDAFGVWGPLQGGCTCKAGHQAMNGTCQACRRGYYKAAKEHGECRACPPNSGTLKEGSDRCDCLQGFHRLLHDPDDLGCTKPPSAPGNLMAHRLNNSVLNLTWDPPHDWGGRQEVMYRVKCEEKAQSEDGQWAECGRGVFFSADSAGLTSTSVRVMGLDPHNDYRLTVHGWNDVSNLMGAPPSSSASVIIHKWKVPPVVMTTAPILKAPGNDVTAAPQSHFNTWLTLGVCFGSLFCSSIVAVVLVKCRNDQKVRSEVLEMQLSPINTGTSYRLPQERQAMPPQVHGGVDFLNENTQDRGTSEEESVARLLEGLSDSLIANLRDVLVERNKLTVGKWLGKGEYGAVFEGLFSAGDNMHVRVAVKTMRVGMYSQEDLGEFLREAESMKNFDHDNVVRLLGVTLQREQDSPVAIPMVILPYMKHGDLRRFLIAMRYGDIPMFFPPQSLLRFMVDISAGMDYLNSQGFLHRDLAARNCMLGDDFVVRVADFGLSRKIHNSNYYRQQKSVRVPVKWLAIESLSDMVYTTKTDVWSFGVTMWEIASLGRTPYPGVQNHELLNLLLSGHRLRQPDDCDHKLYEIMQSCWDEEQTRRPGFKELGEKLEALLRELPILDACQGAFYINQGLEAAAAVSENQQTHCQARGENLYQSSPVDEV
ncbi:tyrosine-protein kinase receptor UFO isoform X1 [Entelurus aequoreus]|uniref:tyrosine-protein kinase receptor UFO isoform X1 n=1 Tax=Entelurus aequoreus TaxID=161455 RepID=UPI002B1DC88A|nr:tyrosine-protein kinase receptor UFO isoform X1 [Entelurus aequoreus]